jgi:hypothetical protein
MWPYQDGLMRKAARVADKAELVAHAQALRCHVRQSHALWDLGEEVKD